MKRTSTKLWDDTLDALREIKKITREPQVLIAHRVIIAELQRIRNEFKKNASRSGDDSVSANH